ncbi:MAG: hypothetical protein IPO85_18650 [Saprospiraceae bacterium]|uniref:Uncharacterized protein n=1 Tax=Candidatus Defluviibacterium haderslevense TaxID=2981993 RepID=A0A9D7SE42_9BACT|nr:hypothetical protein [Candidatus Defluviibacterium haderslevense]
MDYFAPDLVGQNAPDLVGHFTPDLVGQYAPDYAIHLKRIFNVINC